MRPPPTRTPTKTAARACRTVRREDMTNSFPRVVLMSSPSSRPAAPASVTTRTSRPRNSTYADRAPRRSGAACPARDNGDMFGFGKPTTLPTPDQALPGREQQMWTLGEHLVLHTPVVSDDVPDGLEVAVLGLGCFWGAEEIYWQVPGVWSTSVGYAGGSTPNPTYDEVCSGRTGHTEAVRVVFDPTEVSYADLVKKFFEIHDPTQGMRQGNDVGTQYRSAIYWTTPEQEQT